MEILDLDASGQIIYELQVGILKLCTDLIEFPRRIGKKYITPMQMQLVNYADR